jgi:hypothetical protein
VPSPQALRDRTGDGKMRCGGRSLSNAGMDRETARALLARLNQDAERIALRFQLRYQSIEAERPQVKRRYGICYSDGQIRIRLRHVSTGRPLRYSSLVNTLCHELAHLRHMNHGPRFKALYLKVLEWARSEGIYRPGAAEAPALAPLGRPPRTKLLAAARSPEARAGSADVLRPAPPAVRSGPVQLTLF